MSQYGSSLVQPSLSEVTAPVITDKAWQWDVSGGVHCVGYGTAKSTWEETVLVGVVNVLS